MCTPINLTVFHLIFSSAKKLLHRLLWIKHLNVIRYVLTTGYIGHWWKRRRGKIKYGYQFGDSFQENQRRSLIKLGKDQFIVGHRRVSIRYTQQIPVFCGCRKHKKNFFLCKPIRCMDKRMPQNSSALTQIFWRCPLE